MNVFIPQNHSNIIPAPQFAGRVFQPQLQSMMTPGIPAQVTQGSLQGPGSAMFRSNLHILQDNSAIYYRSSSNVPPQITPNNNNLSIHYQPAQSSSSQSQSSSAQKQQYNYPNQSFSAQPQKQQSNSQFSNNPGVFVQDFSRTTQQHLYKQQSFDNQLASSRLTMQSMPAAVTGGFEASAYNSRQHMSLQQKISSPITRATSPYQQPIANQERKPHTTGSVYSPSSRGQSPQGTRNGFFNTVGQNPIRYQTAGGFFQPSQTANWNSFLQQNGQLSEISQVQQIFQLPQSLQSAQARIDSAIARTEKIKQQVISNEMLYSRESEQIRRELYDAPSNFTSASKQREEFQSIFSEEPSPIRNSISTKSLNINLPFKSAKGQQYTSYPGLISQQQQQQQLLQQKQQQQQPVKPTILGLELSQKPLSARSKTKIQQKPQLYQQQGKQSQSHTQSIISSQQESKLDMKSDNAIDDDIDSTLYQLSESKAQFQKLQQQFKSASLRFQETLSKPSLTPTNKNSNLQKQSTAKRDNVNQTNQNSVSTNIKSQNPFDPLVQTQTTSVSAQLKNPNSSNGTPTMTGNASAHKRFLSRVSEHRSQFENIWKNMTLGEKDDSAKLTFVTLKHFKNGLLSYTGSLREALPNGYGVAIRQSDGKEIYKGEWVNGEYSGQGILFNHQEKKNNEGSRDIKNQFSSKEGNDMREDNLQEHDSDRSNTSKSSKNKNIDFIKAIDSGDWLRYEGDFYGNLFQGFGALYLAESRKLIGNFNNNLPNGQCTLYDESNGQIETAIYKNGIQQELLWES